MAAWRFAFLPTSEPTSSGRVLEESAHRPSHTALPVCWLQSTPLFVVREAIMNDSCPESDPSVLHFMARQQNFYICC